MRIAYSGWFLREGFGDIGCEVIPLQLDAAKTLNELVEQTGVEPDVVFIEFFGKTTLPKEFFNCRYKLAAYCIDSSLNEYWLVPLLHLFDFVYVDQLSSVSRFQRDGVQAKWLPLCVSKHDFRAVSEKKHLLSFVGRLTPQRVKRQNLINYLSKTFPVNIVQDVSHAAMLDVFASSRIVLNENFFSGLNLRFFQVLASGSVLLTERQGYGVKMHFREGKHYVGYSPGDIVATIKQIERADALFERIAVCGQEECRQRHTSAHRAQAVVADLRAGTLSGRLPMPDRKLHEAQGKYCHALRFGGKFDESVQLFTDAATASNVHMAHSLGFLGSINLRSGHIESGIASLEKSASVATIQGLQATLKLMLLCADDCRFMKYLSNLMVLLAQLKLNSKKYSHYISVLTKRQETYYNVCMLAYEMLSDLKLNFDLGFYKPEGERFPDYAMEYAVLAFAAKKTTASLDAIITCTKKGGIASEALGYIKEAILAGVASDEHIALSASLAYAYYDFLYADTTIKALKTSIA